MRAVALEGEHRIDHVLDDAGAGDLPVLGDMPDQNDCTARTLGETDQRLRRAAHLRDRAGRGLHRIGPHGLDRVDDDEAGNLALRKGCDDILNRRLGRKFSRRIAQAEPLGAQPHLRDRLLARNVDRPVSRARQKRRGLDQERRLADTGIAADQQHRAAHKAAADDAIHLGHAGGKPRRVVRIPGQRFEREYAAFAGRAGRRAGRGERAAGCLLGQGVPFAAGLALAQPAAIRCTAVLADKAWRIAA
jgi:hypothetical protein